MRVPARTPSHTLVCIISSPHPSRPHSPPCEWSMFYFSPFVYLPLIPSPTIRSFWFLKASCTFSTRFVYRSLSFILLHFPSLLISLFMSSFPGNRHPSKRQALSQPQDSSPPGPSAPPAPSCGKKATKTKSTKQSSSIRKVVNDVIWSSYLLFYDSLSSHIYNCWDVPNMCLKKIRPGWQIVVLPSCVLLDINEIVSFNFSVSFHFLLVGVHQSALLFIFYLWVVSRPRYY